MSTLALTPMENRAIENTTQDFALLYDRILAKKVKPVDVSRALKSRSHLARRAKVYEASTKRILELMPTAKVIRINNVVDYFESHAREKVWSIERDFPCIAPSFPVTWFEFKHNLLDFATSRRVGVLMCADKVERIDDLLEMQNMNADKIRVGGVESPAAKYADFLIPERIEGSEFFWNISVYTVIEVRAGEFGPISCVTYGVNDQGLLVSRALQSVPIMMDGSDEEVARSAKIVVGELLYPALLALTFMHCKNVEVVARKRATKFAQVWERKHKRKLAEYNEIEISPVRKILEGEGDIARQGLKKSLHIVRGHFVHYGPEWGKGLRFGRDSGRFFIEQHTRGSADLGEVKTRYKVDASKAT